MLVTTLKIFSVENISMEYLLIFKLNFKIYKCVTIYHIEDQEVQLKTYQYSNGLYVSQSSVLLVR